jgi:hypothetical protein
MMFLTKNLSVGEWPYPQQVKAGLVKERKTVRPHHFLFMVDSKTEIVKHVVARITKYHKLVLVEDGRFKITGEEKAVMY